MISDRWWAVQGWRSGSLRSKGALSPSSDAEMDGVITGLSIGSPMMSVKGTRRNRGNREKFRVFFDGRAKMMVKHMSVVLSPLRVLEVGVCSMEKLVSWASDWYVLEIFRSLNAWAFIYGCCLANSKPLGATRGCFTSFMNVSGGFTWLAVQNCIEDWYNLLRSRWRGWDRITRNCSSRQ